MIVQTIVIRLLGWKLKLNKLITLILTLFFLLSLQSCTAEGEQDSFVNKIYSRFDIFNKQHDSLAQERIRLYLKNNPDVYKSVQKTFQSQNFSDQEDIFLNYALLYFIKTISSQEGGCAKKISKENEISMVYQYVILNPNKSNNIIPCIESPLKMDLSQYLSELSSLVTFNDKKDFNIFKKIYKNTPRILPRKNKFSFFELSLMTCNIEAITFFSKRGHTYRNYIQVKDTKNILDVSCNKREDVDMKDVLKVLAE